MVEGQLDFCNEKSSMRSKFSVYLPIFQESNSNIFAGLLKSPSLPVKRLDSLIFTESLHEKKIFCHISGRVALSQDFICCISVMLNEFF